MKTRCELKENAKALLKGNLWTVFGSLFAIGTVAALINFGVGLICGLLGIEEKSLIGEILSILSLLLTAVLSFGEIYYILNFARGTKKTIADVFVYLKNNFVRLLLVAILMEVVIALGYVCLVIPGIILSFGLSMVLPIAIDYPELKPVDILKKSWEMMKGHKMEYYVLVLSFFGWILLCIFVIPIVYVIPYMMVVDILYYEELKKLNS